MVDALHNDQWISDVLHNITVPLLDELVTLWDLVEDSEFNPNNTAPDTIVWTRLSSGEYFAKSAYNLQFEGGVLSFFQAGMKELGSVQMQILYVAGTPKSCLDGGSTASTRMAQLVLLPTVHQELGNSTTPVHGVPGHSLNLGGHQQLVGRPDSWTTNVALVDWFNDSKGHLFTGNSSNMDGVV